MKLGKYLLPLFHVFNHSMFLYFSIFQKFSASLLVLSAFIYFFIGCFGISIGYHRLLAHRSFRSPIWFEFFCMFWGCVATGGSPLSWIAVHREHHKFSDTEMDPHSKLSVGSLSVYFHHWKLKVISYSTVSDLLKKKYIVWIHRNYFELLFIYVFFLYLIGIEIGFYLYTVPALMAFHFYGLINLIGHGSHVKNNKTHDFSVNSRFINIVTFGEGWHNNHHQFPKSYRIGLGPRQNDISAWILERLKFARKHFSDSKF